MIPDIRSFVGGDQRFGEAQNARIIRAEGFYVEHQATRCNNTEAVNTLNLIHEQPPGNSRSRNNGKDKGVPLLN
jgi:hypothetical protein